MALVLERERSVAAQREMELMQALKNHSFLCSGCAVVWLLRKSSWYRELGYLLPVPWSSIRSRWRRCHRRAAPRPMEPEEARSVCGRRRAAQGGWLLG